MDEDAISRRKGADAYQELFFDESLCQLTFNREFVCRTFGGVPNRKSTVDREGRSLVFANLEVDPHLPLSCGLSGLMCHATLDTGWKPGPHLLFIAVDAAQYWYLGNYELQTLGALPKEEYITWETEVCPSSSFPLFSALTPP